MNETSEILEKEIEEGQNIPKRRKIQSVLSFALTQGLICSFIILTVVIFRSFIPSAFVYMLEKIHICTNQSIMSVIDYFSKNDEKKEKESDVNNENITLARENKLYMGDGLFYLPDESEEGQEEISESELKFNFISRKIDMDSEYVYPVNGGWISSDFGIRKDPFSESEKFHSGIDIAVNVGTDVSSVMDGTVEKTGDDKIGGKYIIITHTDGFSSYYGHLDKISVKEGEKVTMGSKIGESGNTGKTTGPHLHFEIRKNAKYLNPAYYFEYRV